MVGVDRRCGRKKHPGARMASGRLVPAKVPCACGKDKARSAKRCMECYNVVRKVLKPRLCLACGIEYQPKTSKSRCCGVECGKVYVVRCAQAKRLGDTISRERMRVRRRKGSETRRASGWKAVTGRWRAICQRDGWVCWICGDGIDEAITHPNRMAGTSDHVVPLAMGGSDHDDNLRAAHHGCNSRRGKARIAAAGLGAGVVTSFSMSLGWPTWQV